MDTVPGFNWGTLRNQQNEFIKRIPTPIAIALRRKINDQLPNIMEMNGQTGCYEYAINYESKI